MSVNLNAIHSLSNRGISNNDNTGPSTSLVSPPTPSCVDLRAVNGVSPRNPFAPSTPLQPFAELKDAEAVWRILATPSGRVDAVTTPRQGLTFTLTGGVDFFSQRNDILSPADLQYEPQDGQPGTVVLGKASDVRLNLIGNVVHTCTPASDAYRATTSAGVQYENRNLNFTNIVGRTLALGLQNVSQATSINSSQSEQPVKNVGLYAQEEVLAVGQRLLLTAGVRADRSSVDAYPSKYFVFPKAAAPSWFVQPGSGAADAKLPGPAGRTGIWQLAG